MTATDFFFLEERNVFTEKYLLHFELRSQYTEEGAVISPWPFFFFFLVPANLKWWLFACPKWWVA